MMVAMLVSLAVTVSSQAFDKAVTILDQGSFAAGGTVVTEPGTLNNNNPLDSAGQTLHGDHAYVFINALYMHIRMRLYFSMEPANLENMGNDT